MHDSGPYQTPNDSSKPFDAKLKPRSRMRWAMIGFALGAAIPVAFGFYSFHQQSIYYASLAPNEGACGMGTLGVLAMILVIGPFWV